MSCPFPGMDPYLEAEHLWPAFHHQLIASLYQILQPGLVDRYRQRIAERCYTTTHDVREEYIEIRGTDRTLITIIDVVSIANKMTEAGRAAYMETRLNAKEAKANMAEIDILLQGAPMLEYSRDGLPKWDYAVTVTRANQPERYEIYTATIQKRLPRFRLPLAADDRDTVVDLQVAFTRAYEQGGFASRVDYSGEPATPMSHEDLEWIRELLQLPKHDDIARAAYHIWQEQGCPHGRADEHWRLALERLKQSRAKS